MQSLKPPLLCSPSSLFWQFLFSLPQLYWGIWTEYGFQTLRKILDFPPGGGLWRVASVGGLWRARETRFQRFLRCGIPNFYPRVSLWIKRGKWFIRDSRQKFQCLPRQFAGFGLPFPFCRRLSMSNTFKQNLNVSGVQPFSSDGKGQIKWSLNQATILQNLFLCKTRSISRILCFF